MAHGAWGLNAAAEVLFQCLCHHPSCSNTQKSTDTGACLGMRCHKRT